jgi:acetyl-CoA C-acetyltransferase
VTTEAYIYEAIRTPRGRGKPSGSLHATKPITLLITLLKELRHRHPTLNPSTIDDLILGVVSPLGEPAGYPETLAGVQLNRFCASGLEAVNTAAQKVRSGWEDLILAGGVESMSRVPMAADGGAWLLDPETNFATGFVPQGISADLIATLDGRTREELDAYALRSQHRAAEARADHRFDRAIVPVRDHTGTVILDHDEHPRAGTTPEALAALRPAFADLGAAAGYDAVALHKYHWVEAIDHLHTAGNSSGIVDGAALVLIGSQHAGTAAGLRPRARVVSAAVTGTDPTLMLTGPAPAARKALHRAGLSVADLDLVEMNEAFASVVLHFADDLGVPLDKVNVNGGAIALGHPLGATGAMLIGTLVDELERRGGRYGLATLCVGGGMGVATVIELTAH